MRKNNIMDSISINEKIIKKALFLHLEELIKRLEKGERFTKFDSINDTFAGACGEYAFSLYLYNQGFKIEEDYLRLEKEKRKIQENKNLNSDILKHFINLDGKIYDKYDFIITNLLYNKDKKPYNRDITIDVKTQTRANVNPETINENWQFAVNENTINQLKNKKKNLDFFVFLFCSNKPTDFINIKYLVNEEDLFLKKAVNNFTKDVGKCSKEELKHILNNLNEIVRINKPIELDIGGIIKPKDFIVLAEKFEKNEIFRMNFNSKDLSMYPQKTQSNMYRINRRFLTPIEKIIPTRNILNKKLNIELLKERTEEYIKKSGNKNSDYFIKTIVNNEEFFIPYDKIFKNSQFENMNDFFEYIHKDNKQLKNNNILRNN